MTKAEQYYLNFYFVTLDSTLNPYCRFNLAVIDSLPGTESYFYETLNVLLNSINIELTEYLIQMCEKCIDNEFDLNGDPEEMRFYMPEPIYTYLRFDQTNDTVILFEDYYPELSSPLIISANDLKELAQEWLDFLLSANNIIV